MYIFQHLGITYAEHDRKKRYYTAVETYYCGAILKNLERLIAENSALTMSPLSYTRYYDCLDKLVICLRKIMYAHSRERLVRQVTLFQHYLKQILVLIQPDPAKQRCFKELIENEQILYTSSTSMQRIVRDLDAQQKLLRLKNDERCWNQYLLWKTCFDINHSIGIIARHRGCYLSKEVNSQRFKKDFALAGVSLTLSIVSLVIGIVFPPLLIPAIVLSGASLIISGAGLVRSGILHHKDKAKHQVSQLDRAFLNSRSADDANYARSSLFLEPKKKRESLFDNQSSLMLLGGSACGVGLSAAALVLSLPAVACPPLIPVVFSILALAIGMALLSYSVYSFYKSYCCNKGLQQQHTKDINRDVIQIKSQQSLSHNHAKACNNLPDQELLSTPWQQAAVGCKQAVKKNTKPSGKWRIKQCAAMLYKSFKPILCAKRNDVPDSSEIAFSVNHANKLNYSL